MVLYPNKLPESERVCSGICKIFPFSLLFILVFFVFFLSVMPGSTLNFVYKYNDYFLLLHFRSDSPKSSMRMA